jgi:hypothetical protein
MAHSRHFGVVSPKGLLKQPQQRDVTLRPRGRQSLLNSTKGAPKMSGEEKRGSQSRDFATTTEAQVELYHALEAHKFDLELTRGVSAVDQEILDRRIAAVKRLLEWLKQELEIEPIGPTRRWISHSGDNLSSADYISGPCP